MQYDVCIIGSGAGGGPPAWVLSKAGFRVVVLEKGPWFKTEHFRKDELACCRRTVYDPPKKLEPRVLELPESDGSWSRSIVSFWNAVMVGGSSNIMSGYFHRMKPVDFKLLSTYGEIEGANVVDWPITYDELEPYYTAIETLVGISGKVVPHRWLEPRSTPDFPYPPLNVNAAARWLDNACEKLGIEIIPAPRAILSVPKGSRGSCYYSNYCGSYGCASDAKGSSRVTFIEPAVSHYGLEVRPFSHVYYLETKGNRIVKAWYFDRENKKQYVEAKVFILAAMPVETIRLLLLSKSPEHPNGLGNDFGLVGKYVIYSAGGYGTGHIYYNDLPLQDAEKIKERGTFINRAVQHFYEIEDPDTGKKIKGGMIEFMFEHDNPIRKALFQKWDGNRLVYGSELKRRIFNYFTKRRGIRFEVFVDWLPIEDSYITLDDKVKDFRGFPVARIRAGHHPHDIKVGKIMAREAERILREMGIQDIETYISGYPPPNLVAGGCRMSNDPQDGVTDRFGRVHSLENLFITDASTFPTGGSVQYTWTIYANSLRIAEFIRDFVL